ncbi:UvrD-helicase domain-containing protein [Peribacillus frigoritolerans]|uniref:3'-5' exonuclease n=1 Tax=Peribacillus frigoritolerans TaxID=450367 RepID=UPI0021AAE910|nr:3'-5' exonuclease [Peribacillus frigoritolerans]MCT4479100.1 UvrD-helicase domain-containing protein [Peribacillus frigoritolerans]
MEQGKIKLTEKQQQCVTFKPEGSLLVRGIPGSGKSTIIMARAQYLLKKNPTESLVILTFSRALSNYVRQLAFKTGDNPAQALTFHNWAQLLLKDTNYPHTRLILGENRRNVVQFAKNIINKKTNAVFLKFNGQKNENRALIDFLSDEIEWIKGSDINSRDEYLKIKRAGRGTEIRVTKKHRETIYDVLEKYNELLKNHSKHQGVDSEDLARILIEKVDSIPKNKRPDHILVDEAQDLHSVQLRAINIIAKKSLTVGADKGQQIYRRTFTWKKAGIDVVGNRSRFLDETFRSTKQIVQLANNFQEKDKIFTKDEEYIKARLPETEGKVPHLCLCEGNKEEMQKVIEHIRKIRKSFPEDTIGVIVPRKGDLQDYKISLESINIPVYNLQEDEFDIISPGVKLITFHSSKGLEFDHVIVTGLKKGKLPYKTPGLGEDETEFISRERKKFYVAMTRAKKTLMITAVKPYSSFVEDLEPKLYELYQK